MTDRQNPEDVVRRFNTLTEVTKVLNETKSLDAALQQVCDLIPSSFVDPENISVNIIYNGTEYRNRNFRKTGFPEKHGFKLTKDMEGIIEIYHLYPSVTNQGDGFITSLTSLISGRITNELLSGILYEKTERVKELKGLNQTSRILSESKSIDESLQKICNILPDAYQFPEYTVARISYAGREFTSSNFIETPWTQKQSFEIPKKSGGVIEVFYLKEFPQAHEGPFLKEERDLLINIANLIAGSAIKDIFNELVYENRERLKELQMID